MKKHQYSSLNVGYYLAATNKLTVCVCGFNQGQTGFLGTVGGAVR